MAERFPYPDAKPGDPVRVNLLCHCNNELTFGYGQNVEQARANAMAAFRRHNPKAKVGEEIVEHLAADGSHYEEQ